MIRTLPALLALSITACNGGTDDTDPDTDAGTEVMSNTLVDVASGDDRFDTLVQALIDADLVELLSGDGEFTVFAPTDQAFEDLGVDLSTLSTEELTEILTYHVIAGATVESGDIPALADSAAGFTLFFDTSDGAKVNDANIDDFDIVADNGVIHVIDTVLMPPDILTAAGYAGLSSLATTIGSADPSVATTLQGAGPFTVFAPTNEAFTGADLTGLDVNDVLFYHVATAEVDSASIPVVADSALTNDFGIGVSWLFGTEGGVFVNGAEVVIADVRTTNGIVHVIDEVLVPPTVVDLAVIGGLTGLTGAIGAASGDLGTALSGAGPFTVFAPDNTAFTNAASVTASLSADQLADVLRFHVVGGDTPVKSDDLTNGEVPTLFTDTLTIDLSNGVQVENATVTLADIHGTNGTVHIIDTVMVPPSFQQ